MTPFAAAQPSWRNASFLAPAAAVPLVTLAAMLLWVDGSGGLFRIAQLCLGCALVVQMVVVIARVFERGWYEFFAYLLHFVAIGAAALTVTFRLEQYPQDLLYDQLALVGMAGQLMIGFMALNSGPLKIRAQLDTRVLMTCALIVCSAALIKFGYYIQYVGVSGEHMSIYTDGDAVRDNSPALIRILAAGAPLIGLLALTYPGLPWWCRVLGALSIVLEFAIGIRSRPLFISLAAVAVMQDRIVLTQSRKMMIVGGAILGVVGIAAIGYFRENNHMGAADYFWVILESLFGIFEAGVFGAQIPDTAPIVTGQIVPLLTPTPLGSVDTVAKLLSSTFTPKAYALGFGYSSAALTEIVMLFGPTMSAFIYPIAVFLVLALIKTAATARQTAVFLYGACALPISCYIWRAELWQLAVPAIKAIPFIVVLLGADAYARLTRSRPVLRASTPNPRAPSHS